MLEMVAGVVLERRGEGEPLMLIHGTGGTRAHWEPVIDLLTPRRSLLIPDLPGHGDSPSLREELSPDPIGYAAALATTLDVLGIDQVHVAGNSVGGWTALELAKLGRARSVTAIAPAGLWARRNPRRAERKLRGEYRMGRRTAALTRHLMSNATTRSLLLRGTLAKPRQIPPAAAVQMARDFAATPDFEAHLAATSATRFKAGQAIDVPVTVAWGDKERLIPRSARRREELPEQTRFLTLPGCGHTPMWDDPQLIANTILEASSAELAVASDRTASAATEEGGDS